MVMRTLVLCTLVTALTLLIGPYGIAGQNMGKVTAKLTGGAEVPDPGDPKGSGTAQITIDPEKSEVCYDLSVANIQEATAAHIHEGATGKAGPVKVTLEAPKTGSAKGCAKVDSTLIQAMLKDPAGYYVNVHNAAFPKGAARGQLSK
jgi:CHRD domain-containing protein